MWGGAARHRCQVEVADAVEDSLAAAGYERGNVQTQLVDEPGGEELVERAGASGDRDVPVARGGAGPVERRLYPIRDEVEGGPALLASSALSSR